MPFYWLSIKMALWCSRSCLGLSLTPPLVSVCKISWTDTTHLNSNSGTLMGCPSSWLIVEMSPSSQESIWTFSWESGHQLGGEKGPSKLLPSEAHLRQNGRGAPAEKETSVLPGPKVSVENSSPGCLLWLWKVDRCSMSGLEWLKYCVWATT